LAAVLVALYLAGVEKRERIRREWAEARVIAQFLSYALKKYQDRLLFLSHDLDLNNESQELYANILGNSQNHRKDLATYIGRVAINMQEIERFEGRLFLLSESLARSINKAYISVLSLRDNAVQFQNASQETPLENLVLFARHVRSEYVTALNSLHEARELCIRVSLSADMTWRKRVAFAIRRLRTAFSSLKKKPAQQESAKIFIPVRSDGSWTISGDETFPKT
jgi:hypothetical protein